MPIRKRSCKVVITNHTYERARERGVDLRILKPGRLRMHILGYLRAGAEVHAGAIEVPIGEGIKVICVPEAGYWVAVSVVKEIEHANRRGREKSA